MKNNKIENLIPELSQVCNIDEQTLTTLVGILDYTKCRNLIMAKEFKQAVTDGVLSKKEIVQSLMSKYNISKASVEHVIYSRTLNKARYCKTCRARVSKYKYGKNDCVCDKCLNTNK